LKRLAEKAADEADDVTESPAATTEPAQEVPPWA
jgi:hypothetical protein